MCVCVQYVSKPVFSVTKAVCCVCCEGNVLGQLCSGYLLWRCHIILTMIYGDISSL